MSAGGTELEVPGGRLTFEVRGSGPCWPVSRRPCGGGPADVFGTSGGAVTGLARAARHPELVRTLVAHEPPVTDLLPDAAHIRTVVDDAADAYRAPGGPAAPAPSAKQLADDELFFLRMLKPFTRYQPEVEALRSGGPTVVVAVGQTSGQEVAIRSALTLAERLGTPVAPFPGDHGGFMADPAAFATALREVLHR